MRFKNYGKVHRVVSVMKAKYPIKLSKLIEYGFETFSKGDEFVLVCAAKGWQTKELFLRDAKDYMGLGLIISPGFDKISFPCPTCGEWEVFLLFNDEGIFIIKDETKKKMELIEVKSNELRVCNHCLDNWDYIKEEYSKEQKEKISKLLDDLSKTPEEIEEERQIKISRRTPPSYRTCAIKSRNTYSILTDPRKRNQLITVMLFIGVVMAMLICLYYIILPPFTAIPTP